MTGRDLYTPWVGKRPASMPGTKVLLRLHEAQNGLCACGCGTYMDFDRDAIDCDHKLPLKDGGLNVEANLQLLLRRHHVTKTSAEAVARAAAERHKAKAFRRPRMKGRGFAKASPQHTASRPLRRRTTPIGDNTNG